VRRFVWLSAFRAAGQARRLLITLLRIPKPDTILVQNPPAVPTLAVAWIAARWRGARLIVDWHNLAHTIAAIRLGDRSAVRALRRSEAMGTTRRSIYREARSPNALFASHGCYTTGVAGVRSSGGCRGVVAPRASQGMLRAYRWWLSRVGHLTRISVCSWKPSTPSALWVGSDGIGDRYRTRSARRTRRVKRRQFLLIGVRTAGSSRAIPCSSDGQLGCACTSPRPA
jgi:hypothetical protein